MSNIRFSSFIALGAFVIMASCSPKMEKKVTITDPETGEKTNVSVSKDMFSKDKEINITSEKDGGTLKISQGTMPNSMPSYVEIYPGARELASMQASANPKSSEGSEKGKMTMISFKSNDAPQKIVDFYSQKLSSHGYKQAASMNFGGTQMATLVNEQTKQALQIMINGEKANETTVQLIYGSEDN